MLLRELAHGRAVEGAADVYVCVPDQQLLGGCDANAQALRSALPISAFGYMGGGNLKKQLKKPTPVGRRWRFG